tara:strand:- start:41 stop:490 length:450 start_codon:yes stop_codon:yes gene_type:complete
MENEDNIINLADFYGNHIGNGVTEYRIAQPEPTFDGPYHKEINIPETFKGVILKICPEIIDVKLNGYRETIMYNPENFEPIKKYLVGVDLYFDERNGMKKSKNEYGNLFNDYFKMTYSDLDFVTFHVRSFIFPPEKSNEDKFFEIFGVV